MYLKFELEGEQTINISVLDYDLEPLDAEKERENTILDLYIAAVFKCLSYDEEIQNKIHSTMTELLDELNSSE